MNREHYYVKILSQMDQDKRMGRDWNTNFVYNCNVIDRLDRVQKELALLGKSVTLEALLEQFGLELKL